MSRWSRAPRAPMPPAPGMILPGVPLAPTGGAAVLSERGTDPLADPGRVLAAQQARATQPLPVRIVVPGQPEPVARVGGEASQLDATTPAPADPPTDPPADPPAAPTAPPSPVQDQHAPTATEPAAKVGQPSPELGTAASTPARVPAQRTNSNPFSRGPWPDPNGSAWPKSIPPWGKPPRGFSGSEARVGMVLKDGTRVLPSPADAQQMLGLVASLGT